MSEKTINLDSYNPLDIFGANESNLEQIKAYFPKLKIIARGNAIKLIGDQDEIKSFEDKFSLILLVYDKFGKVGKTDLKQILESSDDSVISQATVSSEVLVHGRNGLLVKARTANQRKMVDAIGKNDLLFSIGPAGTGKTYTAVALAVRALKNKEVRRIVLTRPAVEAGENLGFLPGDLKDKLDPYLQPLYDALRDMLPTQKLLTYMEDGTIEIAPLAFMRGRTLDNVFAILDEAQNATPSQLKMFLTRMGRTSKFLVTGDITQIDLPKNQKSGLVQAEHLLKDIKGISFIRLGKKDIIRHQLVNQIVEAYDTNEEKNNNNNKPDNK
ncbi:MAG: phosphate starvation-inducible protein PhoH [Bacteroidetes bacterium]|nr:phosphate starvation-inducible protein PhoH [Bacteroidota bacterium]|tara:strand:- start:274 stop:1254 length:981 start_codon:yes stop_codon:yes gene_type:complete